MEFPFRKRWYRTARPAPNVSVAPQPHGEPHILVRPLPTVKAGISAPPLTPWERLAQARHRKHREAALF
jgi:hypothetical protein